MILSAQLSELFIEPGENKKGGLCGPPCLIEKREQHLVAAQRTPTAAHHIGFGLIAMRGKWSERDFRVQLILIFIDRNPEDHRVAIFIEGASRNAAGDLSLDALLGSFDAEPVGKHRLLIVENRIIAFQIDAVDENTAVEQLAAVETYFVGDGDVAAGI